MVPVKGARNGGGRLQPIALAADRTIHSYKSRIGARTPETGRLNPQETPHWITSEYPPAKDFDQSGGNVARIDERVVRGSGNSHDLSRDDIQGIFIFNCQANTSSDE